MAARQYSITLDHDDSTVFSLLICPFATRLAVAAISLISVIAAAPSPLTSFRRNSGA